MSALLMLVLSNVIVALVLALAACVVTRVWKNQQLAHLLWLIVLVKLVTPPLWQVPIVFRTADQGQTQAFSNIGPAVESTSITFNEPIMPSDMPRGDAASMRESAIDSSMEFVADLSVSDAITADRRSTPGANHEAVSNSTAIHWPALILAIWSTASGLWLVVAVLRIVRFHRMVTRSPSVDEVLGRRIRELSSMLQLRHSPDVRLLEGNVSPMVWPLSGKRTLLLPRKLLNELTPAQLDTVIAHELAHLVRRDDLVRYLEAAVTCLFWWNPVVWWARRELHRAEEDCCDALVVCTLPESRRQYGEALLRAAEIVTFGRSLPALASAFAQQRFLKRRIEMILMHEFQRGLSWRIKFALLAIAAAVLPLAGTAVSQEEPTTTAPNNVATEGSTVDDPRATSQPSLIDRSASDPNSQPAQYETVASSTGENGATIPWQSPQAVKVAATDDGTWTFIDLDTGSTTELDANAARASEVDEQGFDIRLGFRVDEIDGRVELVAVLRDMAFIEAVGGITPPINFRELADEPLRSDTIPQGRGLFRTAAGAFGMLELTSVEGAGVLQFEVVANRDPRQHFLRLHRPELNDEVLTGRDPGQIEAANTPSTGLPSQLADPASNQVVVDPNDPLQNIVNSYQAVLNDYVVNPRPDTAASPEQPAADPNPTAEASSVDAEVMRLELELLMLDEQAVQIQLDAEVRKLDHMRRLAEQGVPQADVDAQELAVQLLEIEVARARIRRDLFETRMNRLQGTGASNVTDPNSPANVPADPSAPANVPADPDATSNGFSSGFLPGTNSDAGLNGNNPIDVRQTLDALIELNQNAANTPGDSLQTRIEQYDEAYRLQSGLSSQTEPRFPRPVGPEAPLAIVRGVLVHEGQPIANQVIWIVGEENGETVLYQDGPTGDDGRFEFTDVPVNRPWRVFVPIDNGPAGIGSDSLTLTDASDAAIEVSYDGQSVVVTPVSDAPANPVQR